MPAQVTNVFRRRFSRLVGREPVLVVEHGLGAGLRMSLRNASADYIGGAVEEPVLAAVGAHLRPGGVFFDIGGNVGFFSLVAARLVGPSGTVVAFEPVAANAACIRANVERNRFGNVRVIEAAAGAMPGVAPLYVAAHPGGSSLAAGEAPDVVAVTDVPVVTIDDEVGTGRLPAPTFVKIDVEGAEAAVLEGMTETMALAAPVVLCEVDATTPATADERLAALVARLPADRYRIERLAHSYEGSGWHVRHVLALPVPG